MDEGILEMVKGVHEKTMDEVERGWAEGPHNEQRVAQQFGPQ